MTTRYPHVTVEIGVPVSNASSSIFATAGRVTKAMTEAGLTAEQIQNFLDDARPASVAKIENECAAIEWRLKEAREKRERAYVEFIETCKKWVTVK